MVCVEELDQLCRNFTFVRTTLVQHRILLETDECWNEVRRGNEALQDGVHEAGVILSILQAQVRVIDSCYSTEI